MADYGLSSEGFKQKRLTDIIQSMNARIANQLGVQIQTSANSVFGQLVGVFAYEIADLWEQAAEVYGAMYPHTAFGVSLDNSAALAGIAPISAEHTTVICTCYGTNGTAIPYDSQISSASDNNIIFSCVEPSAYIDSTMANYVGIIAPSVVDSAVYSVTLNGSAYSYTASSGDTANIVLTDIASQITTAGITATVVNDVLEISTDDQSKTFSVSVNANLEINLLGSPVKFACTEEGAITPMIGDLTNIITTYAGWDSVNNLVDANTGRLAESDTDLRQRWNSSLYTRSIAMVDSIRSALLQLEGVTAALVYENDTDLTDADGRPPHSIEAVVQGGDPDEIGNAIWVKKSAGIDTYGSESVSIDDSQGFAHTMYFNRPTEVIVSLNIAVVEYPEEALPGNASELIANAALAYGNSLEVGNDVILQRIMSAIYQKVAGIGQITITAATGDPPGAYSSNNISVSTREIAVFDASRIVVTIS